MSYTGNSLLSDGPIIKSRLDTDFYKFTMAQMIFRYYRDVEVELILINRSKMPLAEIISEEDLRRELDFARTVRFNNSELHYLRGTNECSERMFSEDFLEFIGGSELPPYTLERIGKDYRLKFLGPWVLSMFWETFALSIVSELYYRHYLERMSRFERNAVFATGVSRLMEKIKLWRQYPGILFSDFGTRRRFCSPWQDYEVGVLAEELPIQFRGTSNVLLANRHGLLPMGTCAHETFMVIAALAFAKSDGSRPDSEILIEAQNEVLAKWYELYGSGLSIALTDTFGSPFFFKTAPDRVARDWKGTRQDSGDPFRYGEQAIEWHMRHGANPADKLIVFSDQLNAELMTRLYLYFYNRVKTTYGIGTNLTNDLGLNPISLVVKPAKANGRSTVKLSDNLAKAMGDPVEVERYKRAAGYINTEVIECVS